MMTVQIHFGFLCGALGRLGTAYLKKEFRDFPIPQLETTIAIGDSENEYSGEVVDVVIDPETREASVFLESCDFDEDQFDEYEKAIEFMKARGWQ
jgi:hypothetical protein